jgi:hypothetical protein
VLNVGWQHYEAMQEADGLRARDSAGAVRLVDAMVVGESTETWTSHGSLSLTLRGA